MRTAPTAVTLGLILALSACTEPTNGNDVISADQSEQDYMNNGMSSERSSGPSGIGDTNLGTTGQSRTGAAASSNSRAGNANASREQPQSR